MKKPNMKTKTFKVVLYPLATTATSFCIFKYETLEAAQRWAMQNMERLHDILDTENNSLFR